MNFKKIFTRPRFRDAIALLAGALLTLSFAPFEIYPLAVLSPAVLLYLWLDISPKRAFFRGWLYGVGLFSTGVYWVFTSIHLYGNASGFLAAFITGGFVAILALFPAINGYLLNRYFPTTNRAKLILAFPASWVALEWIRTQIFTGFPWLLIGYSQTNSPLKGFAPVASVLGISLAVVISAGLLIDIVIRLKQKDFRTVYFNLTAFALIWATGGYLSFMSWTKPFGAPVKVSLVQGSIPEQMKWSSDMLKTTIDRYVDLSKNHWDSQIIIWPESALPIAMQSVEDLLNNIDATAKKHHTTFITGIPVKVPDEDTYYNAVVALGDGHGYYLKRRLVPFGEYVPFDKLLHHMLDILNIPMSNFVPGKNTPEPLQVGKLKISAFICYEIAFPELVVSRDKNINMLLTVSNDAWFGDSIAQPQHLEMAQMRALEMQRPILFVSNDGITAVIDANGNIQSKAPQHVPYVLTDTVQGMKGKTPWQEGVMDPLLLTLIGLFVAAFFLRKE